MERFIVKKGYTSYITEDKVKNSALSSFDFYRDNVKGKNLQFNNHRVDRDYLSFINSSFDKIFDRTVRNLISKEVYLLEKFSPKLGDDLLNLITNYFICCPHRIDSFQETDCNSYFLEFFNNKISAINPEKFSRKHITKYINQIKDGEAKMICRKVNKLVEPEDVLYLEETNREKTVIKKTNNIFLDISFDHDFLLEKDVITVQDYCVILVDGFIDSIGEVHHLLHKSSEDKKKYIIFCKGMRDEVKHTILLNLQRSTIRVYPVSLDINEENVNILNDIAAILGLDIVSSTKGDVISVEMRKDLPVRNGIKISKKGIEINKSENNSIDLQIMYLKNKIKNTQFNNPNVEYLNRRLKSLNSKKIKINLRANVSRETISEIDGYLKFLDHGKSGIFQQKGGKIYSLREIFVLYSKFSAIVKSICNLGCAIVGDENV